MNKNVERTIVQLKRRLDQARREGDQLKVELAESALNQLLDRITTNEGTQ